MNVFLNGSWHLDSATTTNESEVFAPRCSVKEMLLKIFAKFTGKHLCQSLFFNKVTSLKPATFLRLQNIQEYLFIEHFGGCFCRILGNIGIKRVNIDTQTVIHITNVYSWNRNSPYFSSKQHPFS